MVGTEEIAGDRVPDLSGDVSALWSQYVATGGVELRNRLVLQYAPLVKYVAGRVRSGLPRSVEDADLISEGVIGLMDAIEKFQPDRGFQFQTYAVPRIRGAILDGLRATDWVPRSVRAKARDIEGAQVTLESRLGRTPTDQEIAAELQISLADLRGVYRKMAYTRVASLDELAGDDLALSPADALEDEQTRAALLHAITALTERDRIIIALYYFEGLTLSEIGQVLGVTESRISQLHTRAAQALRARLTLASAA
jgi:RNA polymerase sigma factor for flagellar operon FliA